MMGVCRSQMAVASLSPRLSRWCVRMAWCRSFSPLRIVALDVVAGAEALALAAQHDDGDAGVLVGRLQGLHQRL